MPPWLSAFTVSAWTIPAWILLAGPAAASPACAGPVKIASARLVRVERNGVLVMPDGRAAVLEGIRLPHIAPGLLETAIAPDVLTAIRAMTATAVTFTAPRPQKDRYGRLRAQVFVDGAWLQGVLLEKGLALADPAADRGECASQLYAAEARARAARVGIWRDTPEGAPSPGSVLPRTWVLTPRQMQGREGTFQVMEGQVTGVGRSGSRVFIDFGGDWRQGFSAMVAPEDKKRFKGVDLDALVTRSVRIRGVVQDYRGRPEIVLSGPAQIEVLGGHLPRPAPAP